jgi:hypothetical protein
MNRGVTNAMHNCRRVYEHARWAHSTRRALALYAIAGASLLVGCQQSDSLHGKVTYNGEAVKKGSITFLSADGEGSGFSAQVADGAYASDRLKLGKHIAIVRGVENAGPVSKDESIKQRTTNPHGLATDYIPEDAKGNSQSVDITGGAQNLDFVLEGPPRSG